jgi:hypothetical protein
MGALGGIAELFREARPSEQRSTEQPVIEQRPTEQM